MLNQSPTDQTLVAENAALRERLESAEASLRALRAGGNSIGLNGNERRHADKEHSLLDTLVRTAPVGFAFLDRDLHFLRINDRLAAMNGIPAEAHIGRTVAEIVPALLEFAQDMARRILATGEAVLDHELTGETPAAPGVTRHWCESWYPVREGGEIIGFGVVVEEITERKHAEAALAHNAALFSKIIEQAPGGVYVMDGQLRVQEVNTEALPVFATVQPVIGREVGEVLDALWGPELGQECTAILRHTLETGERYISPRFEHLRRDIGEQQAYEWETQRLTLPDGQNGVVCYFQEVTERERAAAALRESEELHRASDQRMRLATEATGVGIWEWNVPANRIHWDATMFAIYGVTPTADGFVPYETWSSAVLPEDLAEQEAVLQDTVRRCGHSSRAFRIRRANDGEIRHIEAVETIRTNAQGLAEWVVGTNLDITERKQAEQEMIALNETLEERVVARTVEANRHAAQVQALATELTEVEQRERRRLALILHDHLQQMLFGARLKLESVRSQLKDEKLADILAKTEELVAECASEVRSLSHQLSPPILHESGLFAALTWLAQEQQERYGLKVDLNFEASAEPSDEALRVILFHSVRELLFNIVKHARVKGAEVTLTVISNGHLSIEVRDEGEGFDPEELEAGERKGVGLASIRDRLRLFGGTLSVTSAPGQGTCILMTAPLQSQSESVATKPAAAPETFYERRAAPRKHLVPTSRVRVMVVDDHPLIRASLAEIFGSHPEIEIVGEAGDGQEAILVARQSHPDLIFMDINMPGMGGVEATQQILAEQPQTRIVGLTMHERGVQINAMLAAGAAACLCKNESAGRLREMILEQVGVR